MNTQGLIITLTTYLALGEEDVGKHPPFIIPEGFMRQLFTQNKVQNKELTDDHNTRLFFFGGGVRVGWGEELTFKFSAADLSSLRYYRGLLTTKTHKKITVHM